MYASYTCTCACVLLESCHENALHYTMVFGSMRSSRPAACIDYMILHSLRSENGSCNRSHVSGFRATGQGLPQCGPEEWQARCSIPENAAAMTSASLMHGMARGQHGIIAVSLCPKYCIPNPTFTSGAEGYPGYPAGLQIGNREEEVAKLLHQDEVIPVKDTLRHSRRPLSLKGGLKPWLPRRRGPLRKCSWRSWTRRASFLRISLRISLGGVVLEARVPYLWGFVVDFVNHPLLVGVRLLL